MFLLKTYINPPEREWPALLQRPAYDLSELEPRVRQILSDIKEQGDRAVLTYTERFDKVHIDRLEVLPQEFAEAERLVPSELKAAIDLARDNIEKFHQAQRVAVEPIETMPGVKCWQKSVPIQKVGLYVPGGKAPLFSTVLMLGIPAAIAGCDEIVLCTPPDSEGKIHPAILYTAKLIGIDHVFKVGGVQAIGAMAYGTKSIPAVFKIFGPGNQYVTLAKQIVSQQGVAIDMPAGPSEVLVVANDSSNADFVAYDLLSQAEHGPDSQVILVANRIETVNRVEHALERHLAELPRRDLAEQSLTHSHAFVMDNLPDAVALINAYAPEHLIICTKNYQEIAANVINAGSVFLGQYTPESAGDYASGTNHTLPTNGYARSFNGVNFDSYVRKITFQQITEEGLQTIGPAIETMATTELLDAHRLAVSVRLDEIRKRYK